MKRISLISRWIAASRGMMQAYTLWANQGGMGASINSQPATRLAQSALKLAKLRKAEADWYLALDRLFPFGYSAQWNRKGAA